MDDIVEMPMQAINCSTYDPCGRYGYCEDDDYGQWTCVCKFWWQGTLCDTQSSSGKQVIALTVVLGMLMLLYYTLNFIRYIKKRRQTVPTKTAIKIDKPRTERVISIISSPKNSRLGKLHSSLMIIGTVIVGFLALFIKRILIQSINASITMDLDQQKSFVFSRHALCPVIEIRKEFNIITFPLACLLILIFAIITKRNRSKTSHWFHSYGALPMPVDFFAHVERTFTAVVFAVYADELLDIVKELVIGNDSIPPYVSGVVLVYLMQIVRVFIIGFRRYPVIAAVYLNTVVTLACATLYTWLDFAILIFYSSLCQNDFYPTDSNFNHTEEQKLMKKLNFYGTNIRLVYFQLAIDVPQYLCLSYISIKLPVLLWKRIRQRLNTTHQFTREQEILLYSSMPHSAEAEYVRNLFGARKNEESSSTWKRMIRKIYHWRNDFRFSTRVISTYASVFLLLFYITVQMILYGLPLLDFVQHFLQAFIGFLLDKADSTEERSTKTFPIPDLKVIYLVAISITLMIMIVQLLVLLVAIRRNLLQAFRGDTSEIPRRTASNNVEYACGNVHFAGYFIGYLLWGFILVGVLVFIFTLIVGAFVRFGRVRLIEEILKALIPIWLMIGFKGYFNTLITQYGFLQDDGDTLSLANRRLFMVYVYFNFFLDAFLGFVSSVIRIGRGIIGGIVYMCRLDYATIGRKLENMDEGFSAYCGFIHMECVHRHPVMLFFASHLLRQHLESTGKLSRALRKWHLVVFLITNPALAYRRKAFISRPLSN